MAHMLQENDTMFSVRETPWHGLGTVLDAPPTSIEDALEKSGLSWRVKSGDLMVVETPEYVDDFGQKVAAKLRYIDGFKANVREDTGDVLGIVSNDYKIVDNKEAFRFLDDLIGSELHYETAGSLYNNKRVWVLVKIPDFVEVGGDQMSRYIYVANAHDGSMSVIAAATMIRIVCANTLNWAISKSEAGGAPRVYKFRHTGDLQLKFAEARKVMELTINWAARFKEMGDKLALTPMPVPTFEGVLEKMFPIDTDTMGTVAIRNRKESRLEVLDIFRGKGVAGDTSGNSPLTAWTAANAISEFADWHRRYTKRTDQVARSFEDEGFKAMGLALVKEAVA